MMARGDGKEGPHSELYRSGPWKRVRKVILLRDPRCMIRGAKCSVISTEVDHIVPLSMGGAPLDPNNLRGACVPCNRGRRPGKPRPAGTLPPSREW